MKVAAITMVYNEHLYLPIWLRYYGRSLGAENLFVIDHGSDDGSTARHAQGGWNRIRLPRDEFDEEARAAMLSHFAASLLKYYDVVMYTDCDEMLLPDPEKHASLKAYCEQLPHDAVRAVGVDVVHIPRRQRPFKPRLGVLEQRRFGVFAPRWCKPLIVRKPVTWAPGFHNCRSLSVPVDPELSLFHLKYIDLDACLARLKLTREQIRWSARTFEINASSHHRAADETLGLKFHQFQQAHSQGLFIDWNPAALVGASEPAEAADPEAPVAAETEPATPPMHRALIRIPDRYVGQF